VGKFPSKYRWLISPPVLVRNFRTNAAADQSVSDIVKEHAARLRLDPGQFAGHSLRAGFLTSAASRGASIFKMMDVSRHRSVDTLRGYVRDAELFKDHAGAGYDGPSARISRGPEGYLGAGG
jgi:hypothetical protein